MRRNYHSMYACVHHNIPYIEFWRLLSIQRYCPKRVRVEVVAPLPRYFVRLCAKIGIPLHIDIIKGGVWIDGVKMDDSQNGTERGDALDVPRLLDARWFVWVLKFIQILPLSHLSRDVGGYTLKYRMYSKCTATSFLPLQSASIAKRSAGLEIDEDCTYSHLIGAYYTWKTVFCHVPDRWQLGAKFWWSLLICLTK